VAEESGDADVRRAIGQVKQGEQDGDEALQRVAGEREYRGDPVAGAQHVGRAGILRAIAARIRQAHQRAHNHGK
jgi:hypothetical protein